MSVNPQQSWITPKNSLFGTGGSVANSLYTIPAQPGFSTISDQITGGFDPYNANNIVAVFQRDSGNLAALQLGEYLEVQEGGNGVSSALWRTQYYSDGIAFKAQGSGTTFPYVAVNRTVNGGESFTGVALTNISTINGSVPALGGSGPTIKYGIVSFGTNGQTVVYDVPFTSPPSVFLQPTGNAAGFTGTFQVNNSSTYTTSFQIFYSGALDYGPIEINWSAIGT